jgi:hypothetical protein
VIATKRGAPHLPQWPGAEAAMPLPFSTELDHGDVSQPDAIETRRTALRTIDKFNNVLVTLAEGESIQSVQNSAAGFLQVASDFVESATGSVVPGLEAVTGLVRTLIGRFEKARLRKEFVAVVRTGAPIIDRMLKALIAERGDHITLRADEANLRQIGIVNDITVATAGLRLTTTPGRISRRR